MPTYDYECENCGPFSDSQPMAAFALPQPCPDCGEQSARMLTLPAIGGGAREDAGAAPVRAHPGGCACCAAPGRFSADAV
jgi:putative FmdB family regulatory protein